MESIDKEVFDEDCWRCFLIHPDIPEGVNGGELGACAGGCPSRSKGTSAIVGKDWRNLIRNDIARQRLECPRSNWCQDNNQLFQHS